MSSRDRDLVSACTAMVVGGYYLSEAIRLPLWTLGGVPGAGFLPTLLGLSVVCLSATLLVKALRENSSTGAATRSLDGGPATRPLLTLLALIPYLVLFQRLGYLVTSTALLWFLVWFLDPGCTSIRKIARTSAVSMLMVIAFYMVFGFVLGLQLPAWPSLD